MASQQRINEIIEKIFQDALKMYKDIDFDTGDLHDCLIRLMECVELIPELVGADKKKVVIGVITLLIHHLKITESEKSKIMYMLTHDIIDMMIDLIVRVVKHPPKITPNTDIDTKIPDVAVPKSTCQLI